MAVTPPSIDLGSENITDRQVSPTAAIQRSKLAQRVLNEFPVSLLDFRVWDAFHTALSNTAASDDLALSTGTFGTGQPYITAGDLKAAGATNRRARAQVRLPNDFEAGETLQIRVYAGMKTTAADTTCTIDFEAHKLAGNGTVGSDLVSTAATSINSTTAAAYSFTVDATGLVAGDILDIRMTIACNDAATSTAVEPAVYQVELLADLR